MAKTVSQLPPRGQVKPSDTWDLGSLFAGDEAWESAYQGWQSRIGQYARFRGKLSKDPGTLAAALEFDLDCDRQGERLEAMQTQMAQVADQTFRQTMFAEFEKLTHGLARFARLVDQLDGPL